jgi:hypothetical protein
MIPPSGHRQGMREGALILLLTGALWLILAVGLGSWALREAKAAEPPLVSLELLLTIDVSSSVDEREFVLQKVGIITALRDEKVQRAIFNQRGIALAVMLWSGPTDPRPLAVPWHFLADYAALDGFMQAVAEIERPKGGLNNTAIGAAITSGIETIEANNIGALRSVIDIASDGVNNGGLAAEVARDEAMRRGISINVLTVGPEGDIPAYHRNSVKTPDGFSIVAESYDSFVDAMLTKMYLEIAGVRVDRPPIVTANLE